MEGEDILKLIAKYGPAVGEFISANRRANELTGDQSPLAETNIAEQFDDLRDNLPQYDVGPAFRKYLATAMENPVADAARRRLDETKATALESLGQTPKGTDNLIKVLRQIEGAESRIDAKEQADLAKAYAVYGQQEQMADRLNTQAGQRIDMAELNALRQADLYRTLVEGQKQQATGQAIGKGLELLGDLEFGGGDGFLKNLFFSNPEALARRSNRAFKDVPEDIYDTISVEGDDQFAEKGMITPGAFSHESNPLDVIQDGVKIAELTGGETVLNPDQANQVAKESSFFRKLQRKFRKAQQKRENESK